jgi:hypothetical protein
MARLTYIQKLQRAEARELVRIKRQQKAESKRRQREHEKAVRSEQKAIHTQALKREKKRRVSHRKTKKMFKRAWRKLI